MRRFVLSVVAGLSLGLSFGVNSARAAAGSLDPTFGKSGIVQTSGFSATVSIDAALQADGKIVIYGTDETTQFNGELVRYLPNGTLDTSFGNGGFVQVSPSGPSGGSVALQSDGKYIVAEAVYVGAPRGRDVDTHVVRFTATGNVDSPFNSPIFDFVGEGGSGHFDVPQEAALQANNQVVIVGSHAQPSSTTLNALARLNTDGSLDSTFGNAGIVANTLPAGTDGLHSLLIQLDGKILAIGTANNNTELFVERYLAQ